MNDDQVDEADENELEFDGAQYERDLAEKGMRWAARAHFYAERVDWLLGQLQGAQRLLRSWEAVSGEDLERTVTQVEGCLAAVLGQDPARHERLRLLEAIDAHVYHREKQLVWRAYARKHLGRELSAEDRALLRSRAEVHTRAAGVWFEEQLAQRATNWAAWTPVEISIEQFEWDLRHQPRKGTPHASKISRADLEVAVAVWARHGRPRKTTALPEKWLFFAELMAKIGLGDVQPESLRADWQKWRKMKSVDD